MATVMHSLVKTTERNKCLVRVVGLLFPTVAGVTCKNVNINSDVKEFC